MLKKVVAEDRGLEVQYWSLREDLIKILLGLQFLVKFPSYEISWRSVYRFLSCFMAVCIYKNTQKGREMDRRGNFKWWSSGRQKRLKICRPIISTDSSEAIFWKFKTKDHRQVGTANHEGWLLRVLKTWPRTSWTSILHLAYHTCPQNLVTEWSVEEKQNQHIQ